MNIYDITKEKKVLIAAHRGTCGGNIPCNSIQAFKAALIAGADIIELDVDCSKDGVLFVQHPGLESVHLRMKDSVRNYPAFFLEQLKLSNSDLNATQYPFVKLEDALKLMKGKCIINIDKFWDHPKEISETVRALGMEKDVLIKTSVKPEHIKAVEKYAPDFAYMAVTRNGIEIHEDMLRRKINYVGIEAIISQEEDICARKEFIEKLHGDGKLIWVNAIVYDYKEDLNAGHNDDVSVTEDPELGWGWIADKGYDIIQTDFVYHCRDFLENTGRRTKK